MNRQLKSISEVVWFQEGPGVRKNQYTNNGVKLLNVANLTDSKIDLSTSTRYISCNEAYGKYKHFLVDDGDLIIASSGIKVEYFDKKMGFVTKEQLPLCMNTSTIRFKAINNQQLNIRYFMYYLKSRQFKSQLAKQITGSAQLNFGPSHLKKMHINLVDLDLQNNIVSILDKLEYTIECKKQQLFKYEELVKSRFIEMFGDPVINSKNWSRVKLGKRCDIITGNTPSRSKLENYGTYIEWVKSDNINTSFTYLTEAEEYLSKIGFQKCRFVDTESILMTCIAGSINCIGNVAIANRRVAFNQQINAIVPKNDNALYIYWLMILSRPAIHRTINMALKGILSKGQLSKIEFPFPPMELQEQFSNFAKQIDKSKFECSISLNLLKSFNYCKDF